MVRVWISAMLLVMIASVAPVFSQEARCYVHLNDAEDYLEHWTGSVKVMAVRTLKESNVMRISVSPGVCNPSGCRDAGQIDIRLDDGGDALRIMKKMVNLAYLQSLRIRFRLRPPGDDATCSGKFPIADAVSLPRKTNS